jgi:ElaB/YqjD/DUF883 family membrane-anchored ribosome-binding protein
MDKTTGVDYRKAERDPAEIRSDIEETRAHLGETVEEIKERFSPEHVKSHVREATVGRAKGAIKTTAERTRELSTAALERVKRDPLPYLSIGAGLGMGIGGLFWLLKRQGKNGHGYGHEEGLGSSTQEFYSPQAGQFSEGMAEGTEEGAGAMKELARKTQEKARRAKEQAGIAIDRAKEKTGELRDLALERSRELKSHVGDSLERNPFVLGSLFFALGSAIGFLFPSMAGSLGEKVGTLDVGELAGGGEEEETATSSAHSEGMGMTSTHAEMEPGEAGPAKDAEIFKEV